MRLARACYHGGVKPDLLAQTRIVLIRPSLPENVGAVARSMANFGLSELVLVEGVEPLHPQAVATAAGHEALLRSARVVDSLEAALAGATFVVGTTARPQGTVERQAIRPDAAARLAAAHAASGRIALVFGTEKSGMSNDELRRCDQLLSIPGEPDTCLNLAHALTVCAYEWRKAAAHALPSARPASAVAAEAGLDDLAAWLGRALEKAGALKPREKASKLHSLRRIVSRAELSPDEAAMLQGLLRAALREG